MAKTRKNNSITNNSNGETAAGATVAGDAAAEVPAKPKKRRRKSVPRESPSQRSSVYRGVTRHRYTGQFEARLWDKNSWKQVYLGAYDDEEAAAQAYDLAALKTWGPDTILNFPAVLPEVAASAGPSSSRQVPADGAAALPSKSPPASVASSAGCTPYAVAPAARPNVTVDIDAFSSKRRTLLADADSSVIFAAMEELHDNGFYEFRDDDELEQMEDLGLHESLQQCVPRSEAPKDEPCSNPTAAAAGEEVREPGPSTKRPPKVPPLTDDEVSKFECGICLETLDVLDLFHGMPCEHKYCTACITKYVELKIREGYLDIPCPDPACKDILHPEKCKKVIDFAAFSDWGMRLAESAIPLSRRAYCPNRRCGIMLETSGEERPAMAPCPACDHLLCASCGLEYWSVDGSGKHDCDKGPDAELVRKLAEALKWKKCSKCEMTIERVDGCRRITCRCHLVFCYLCGLPILRSQVGEGGEVCQCNDTFDVDDVDMDHPLDADMPQQDDDHLDT